ncbi:MAG: hypothetical protein DRN04_10740 [Thermoprotei archaeon]|mgnify:CR=1 FL=1|nr:MAG: hypothetical protein DRN04_10740 [Thermoprotei archaeon]
MGKKLDLIERLSMLIPGYRGYKQKELIREDDRLVREKAALKIDEAKRLLEEVMPSYSGDYEVLEKMDSLRKDLEALAQKIRHASLGYRGLFDRVKIREEELRKLLDYDYKLVTLAEEINKSVKNLASLLSEKSRLVAGIAEVKSKVLELDLVVSKRSEVAVGGAVNA